MAIANILHKSRICNESRIYSPCIGIYFNILLVKWDVVCR